MEAGKELVYLLDNYTQRNKKAEVPFVSFLDYVRKVSQRNFEKFPGLERFLKEDTEMLLTAELHTLQENGQCQLDIREDTVHSILFAGYYTKLIQTAYQRMDNNPEEVFPSEREIGTIIPDIFITPVDVKSEFTDYFSHDKTGPPFCRLIFPSGINSMIAPRSILGNRMVDYSLKKIRVYLSTRRNADYIRTRMLGSFKNKDQMLRDLFKNIMTGSQSALTSLIEPTTFTFQFWSHLAGLIVQEFRTKKDKSGLEQSWCQAAYMLGYYNMHFKGVSQKRKQRELAIQSVETQMRRAPYFYSISDIMSFKDKTGTLLSQQYEKSDLENFLTLKTTTEGNEKLPDLIHLRTRDRKEYYIYQEMILPLTVKKIFDAHNHYRDIYSEEWSGNLNSFRKTKEMQDDEAFVKDLTLRLSREDPLLMALLRFELLFLCSEQVKTEYETAREIERILDRKAKKLVSLDEILSLNRQGLLSTIKRGLPLWITSPFLSRLFRFFAGNKHLNSRKKPAQKVSTAKSGGKEIPSANGAVKTRQKDTVTARSLGPASAGTAKTQRQRLAQYRQAVKKLEQEFVSEDRSIDETLKTLADKWNPLFDAKAKSNLVEDVNALIRDYMRTIKRSYAVKPLDADRIRSLASTLADNTAVENIKKKNILRKYIEVYIIKQLQR